MRMADFSATETAARSGLPRSRRKVAMITQAGLLMECFAEILCSRFPDYEILTCEKLTDIPSDMVEDIKLVLVHYQDLSRIEQIASYFKDETTAISIGVIVSGSEIAHPILRQLMEGQRINGVLPLSLHLDVFLAGIELLAKGGEHFPSTLLQQARPDRFSHENARRLRNERAVEDEEAGRSRLTIREEEILDLVCKGTQNKNIAGTLKLSENTVKAHIRNIYKKMHVRNRTEAASQYFAGATKHSQFALMC